MTASPQLIVQEARATTSFSLRRRPLLTLKILLLSLCGRGLVLNSIKPFGSNITACFTGGSRPIRSTGSRFSSARPTSPLIRCSSNSNSSRPTNSNSSPLSLRNRRLNLFQTFKISKPLVWTLRYTVLTVLVL